jgi:hypothetical protein
VSLREAGRTEIDYYGDWIANGGEYNKRHNHNAVNFALYEAIID